MQLICVYTYICVYVDFTSVNCSSGTFIRILPVRFDASYLLTYKALIILCFVFAKKK